VFSDLEVTGLHPFLRAADRPADKGVGNDLAFLGAEPVMTAAIRSEPKMRMRSSSRDRRISTTLNLPAVPRGRGVGCRYGALRALRPIMCSPPNSTTLYVPPQAVYTALRTSCAFSSIVSRRVYSFFIKLIVRHYLEVPARTMSVPRRPCS